MREGYIFSKIDLKSAFWQVPIHPDDQFKTGFQVDNRIFFFKTIPFGLSNAPACMQRLIDKVLTGIKGVYCYAYLDDIIIFSKNMDEHLAHINEIFKRLKQYGLRISLPKCSFLNDQIIFLGHLISHGKIKIDPDKIISVQKFPIPSNVKSLQSFLGLAGYCRRFIHSYSTITAPLTNLLRSDVPWTWGPAQNRSFNSIREAISTSPVLAQPDYGKQFFLECDASDYGLGAALLQESDTKGQLQPICFISRKLNNTERKYSTREKEFFCIIWSIDRLKQFLHGRKFTVYTDHKSLIWINNPSNENARVARWCQKIAHFQFEIKFKPGKSNILADALSRSPVYVLSHKNLKILTITRAQAKKNEQNNMRDNKKDGKRDKRMMSDLGHEVKRDGSEEAQSSSSLSSVSESHISSRPSTLTNSSSSSSSSSTSSNTTPTSSSSSSITGTSTKSKPSLSIGLEDTLSDDAETPAPAHKKIRSSTTTAITSTTSTTSTMSTPSTSPPSIESLISEQIYTPPRPTPLNIGKFAQKSDNEFYPLPDLDTFRKSLLEDQEYKDLILFLENKHALVGFSPDFQTKEKIKRLAGFFEYKNGLLYFKKSEHKGEDSSLLEIPTKFRRDLIRCFHDTPMGGHRGRRETLRAIQIHYHWPNMASDVENYVKDCLNCFLTKTPNPQNKGLLALYDTDVLKFQIIHLDYVGPLPATPAGNTFILSIRDRGSGLYLGTPTREATGQETAKILWSQWISRYGCPVKIITDNGTPFIANVFTNLTKLMGINVSRITAYRPQSNGLVERDHRSLKSFLKAFCLKNPKNWDTYLPAFNYVINNNPRKGLGYSPFYITFGLNPRPPTTLYDNTLTITNTDDYVSQLLTKLDDIQNELRTLRHKIQQDYKIRYDMSHVHTEFNVGDIVYKRLGKPPKGTVRKFWIPWRGPYRVIEVGEKQTVTISDDEGSLDEILHVSKLATFKRLDSDEDPELIFQDLLERTNELLDKKVEDGKVEEKEATSKPKLADLVLTKETPSSGHLFKIISTEPY